MKKFFPVLLIVSLIVCSFFTVNAEESMNVVDEKNSGFEKVTDLKETNWYKLIDAKGSTNSSASIFNGIEIKTDGGHTGDNYLSATLKQSWFSPSINIYPFIKDAGADAYILSFYYKSNKNIKLTKFLVRALATDAYEDSGEFQPDITSKGQGNYYGYLNGTSTDPDANGWRYFISDPFEVVDEQFDGDHNWWFCLDQLKASSDDPLILDIDDFVICSELDFEAPEEIVEKEIVTDITYLSDELKSSVIPVTIPENATPTPEATVAPEPSVPPTNNTLIIVIGCAAFLAGAAITSTIIIIAKKKKK